MRNDNRVQVTGLIGVHIVQYTPATTWAYTQVIVVMLMFTT